jgi:putative transposase
MVGPAKLEPASKLASTRGWRSLKAAEAAGNIRAVCREHNITEQTFYRWRNKYGGMDVAEARKLRELEKENAELKKMVAEQALDIRMLKELNEKKW